METFDDYIKYIKITPLGKFVRTFPSKLNYNFEDIEAKNGILTTDKDFIMNAGQFTPSAGITDVTQNLDEDNIKVEEITYEVIKTKLGNDVWLINSMVIVTTSHNNSIKLQNLGLKPTSIEVEHISNQVNGTEKIMICKFNLSVREIYWILAYKGSKIAEWLADEYHLRIGGDLIEITNITTKNKENTRYIEDNTRLEKLKIWKNKMSIMGLLDDYLIDASELLLLDYKGTNQNPSLPPVRAININNSNTSVRTLVIPSTVNVIRNLPKQIESLNIQNAQQLHLIYKSSALFKNLNSNRIDTKSNKLDFTKVILKDFADILKAVELGNSLEVKINYLQLLSIQDVIRTELHKLTTVNI